MARTGLRMMPTSPSPSLKFRTAGFPRYGSKASMSDSAFLNRNSVKPAPGVPSLQRSLHPSFAHFHVRYPPGSASRSTGALMSHCSRDHRLSTPGVLGSGPSYAVSAIIAYYDPIRQSRRHAAISYYLIRNAFAVRERLGDPRDLPYFHCCAFRACCRPCPGGPSSPPVVLTRRFQASSNYH